MYFNIYLYKCLDNYDSAEQFLNTYIEQSTSDNTTIVDKNNLVRSKCNKIENSNKKNNSSTLKRKKKQKNKKMSCKRNKKIVRSPTPSSSTSTEDLTDSVDSSSTTDVTSSNSLNIDKKREIKNHIFMNRSQNNTGFLLQRTVSGPLQHQLEHIKNIQPLSQQISAGPVITSIQPVSGIITKLTPKLGCNNIKETSFDLMETDKECQPIDKTFNSGCSIETSCKKNFVPLPETEFQRVVLSYLQSIEITYEQILSKINILLRNKDSTQIITSKPEGLPELPLSTMEQFQEMETLLDTEENYNYYRTRLASIGGENQRSCVMSMLKFLLSNKLATYFNWAGRKNKIAFKNKKIMNVIYESARLVFGEINGPYTGDKIIENAVKDWLKLASNRLSYYDSKKTNCS
ncbi:hypothetical protein PUN28_003703 [Cardiocondyla obscurior]|uniref:DUF4806 domain-containing protein n=1 Tax=Cardiocondyla obscurior TaxID=286306 RepID=A0AAW2GJZ1_9HYME